MEGKQSKAADVYSYGMTLWELFTGGSPYKGESLMISFNDSKADLTPLLRSPPCGPEPGGCVSAEAPCLARVYSP